MIGSKLSRAGQKTPRVVGDLSDNEGRVGTSSELDPGIERGEIRISGKVTNHGLQHSRSRASKFPMWMREGRQLRRLAPLGVPMFFQPLNEVARLA